MPRSYRINDMQDHDYVDRSNEQAQNLETNNQAVRPRNVNVRRSRRLNVENTDHDYLATSNSIQDDDDEGDLLQGPDIALSPLVLRQQRIVLHDVAIQNAGVASTSGTAAPEAQPTASPNTATSSLPKKRKRIAGTDNSNTPTKQTLKDANNDDFDDEDGLTCPICLDSWEMSGDHRLVALRCGHLFGDSCIRRWLVESARQTGVKTCPQCKTKATYKDIRFIYAKRLRAIDRSEEHRLRERLDTEVTTNNELRTEVASLKMSFTMFTKKAEEISAAYERMKQTMQNGAPGNVIALNSDDCIKRLARYKLFMSNNIEVAREGCRVMIYSSIKSYLAVSQRSAQTLFPGYGLTFIDTNTFQKINFMHTSTKIVRDITFNSDHQLVATASMESRMKLFDLRTRRSVNAFSPCDKALWACAMDRMELENIIHLGAQNGSCYTYDMRFPTTVLNELKNDGDYCPVINIAAVGKCKDFPYGGLLVCKLQSIWFYEYTEGRITATGTRLSVDGPFVCMNYDITHELLLVSARSSARSPQARYLLGKLTKIDGVVVFSVQVVFGGSMSTPIMTRCSQIAVENNTLIAGYLQDVKLLALYDVRREEKLQTMQSQQIIYDICPIYKSNATYMAALTETKCRIFEVSSKQC